MYQLQGESFDEFFSRIQSQGKKLEFGDSLDRLMIYKIILGIRNDMVRRELMYDADLSLIKTIEVCHKSEKTWKRWKNIEEPCCLLTSAAETTNQNAVKRKYHNEFTAPQVIYFDGNVPEIQNINADSLRHIFRYMNLMDVVNLSKTCVRFLDFAQTDFFPQYTKEIRIDIAAKVILLKAPLVNTFISELTLKNVEAAFSYFDQFIEDLTFILKYVATPNEQAIIWRSTMMMMAHCQNLTSLHYNSWFLTYDQADELQDQIEKFEYLKELDISRCYGITNNWRAAYSGISKIEKLSFTARDEISSNFLDYFTNLTSLTIDFRPSSICQTGDLARIFENNGHCLQYLKLSHLSDLKNYSSVGRLIAAKLPKLKSLDLGFNLTNQSKYMIELAHLKSLRISCAHCNIHPLLRTLSNSGFIEELAMIDGVFIDDGERASPLIFEKLKSFSLHQLCKLSGFWNSMIGSQMPVLHSLDIELFERSEMYDLIRFFESKKTIRYIRLSYKRLHHDFIPLKFLDQIIQVLKEPCVPQRPFLKLNICQLQLDDVQVITIMHINAVQIITILLYYSSGNC